MAKDSKIKRYISGSKLIEHKRGSLVDYHEYEKLMDDYIRVLDELNNLKIKLELPNYAKTGIGIIAGERWKQIKNGYKLEYDWHHTLGQLSLAASSYAIPPEFRIGIPNQWPFSEDEWKPSPENRIKELAKAGALIAAEIDRLSSVCIENSLLK